MLVQNLAYLVSIYAHDTCNLENLWAHQRGLCESVVEHRTPLTQV